MKRRPQLSFEAETHELSMRFDALVKKLKKKDRYISKSAVFNQAMKDFVNEQSIYKAGPGKSASGNKRENSKITASSKKPRTNDTRISGRKASNGTGVI